MILPAQMIRARGIFVPFNERTIVSGMSYGLSSAGYDVRVRETITLNPGVMVLASTLERFFMPEDVLGVVHDKSTWARRGIAVQNTVIEPGWRGYLTLEITNHSAVRMTIEAGWPIAQIVLHLLAAPTEQPYDGKYQDQKAGPQPARLEKIGV
jgi:dCTP deaminase